MRRIHFVEHQTGGLRSLVMTSDAVLIDQRAWRRVGSRILPKSRAGANDDSTKKYEAFHRVLHKEETINTRTYVVVKSCVRLKGEWVIWFLDN